MKLDSAIKSFTEKYDKEAIQSIEDISKEFGLVVNGITIKEGFNLQESFELFTEFLNNYCDYKIKHPKEDENNPNEKLIQRIEESIKNDLFVKCDVKYSDLPIFVEEYINGINTLISNIDSIKQKFIENDIDQNYITTINECVDLFINEFNKYYDPFMDRVLKASGYHSKKILFNKNKQKMKPVFL
jgi:hypothetical protein